MYKKNHDIFGKFEIEKNLLKVILVVLVKIDDIINY